MHRSLLAFALLAVTGVAEPLSAQGFRVFTRIYDISDPANAETAISNTTTLFHAGRVYDYVAPAGEVVVLDHGNRTITLLDTERRVTTTVDFDEVQHLLKRSRTETLDYADRLAMEPGGERGAAILRFHLDPEFEVVRDPMRRTLDLRSRHIVYTAVCAEPASDEQAAHLEAYLRYADWASRLNHVLNPHAPFPAPRVALDEQLRKQGWLPVEVTLETRTEAGPRRFKAVHRTHWELTGNDRRMIHHWMRMLEDEQGTKRVSFRKYQQTVLTATAR